MWCVVACDGTSHDIVPVPEHGGVQGCVDVPGRIRETASAGTTRVLVGCGGAAGVVCVHASGKVRGVVCGEVWFGGRGLGGMRVRARLVVVTVMYVEGAFASAYPRAHLCMSVSVPMQCGVGVMVR